MKITKRLERDAVAILSVLVVFAACVAAARADVGPRVKITMPIDSPQAVAGQPYDGVFEVHVREPGVSMTSNWRVQDGGFIRSRSRQRVSWRPGASCGSRSLRRLPTPRRRSDLA